jgi:hypothetical protein
LPVDLALFVRRRAATSEDESAQRVLKWPIECPIRVDPDFMKRRVNSARSVTQAALRR